MKKRAFTLVETLVAIAIITVVLAAPFHTAEEAVNASYISRDEITGDSLAQEGIEFVESIRDNNYLWNQSYPASPVTWLAGLDGTAAAPSSGTWSSVNCFTNSCAMNSYPASVVQCPTSNCSTYPLDLYTSSGATPYIYNINGASASNIQTRFTREFYLTNLSANEVEVTVKVYWVTEGQSYSTTLNDYLQNYL
jgi:prepilin-type N-terminal cleavage/methylation domain-containing protein